MLLSRVRERHNIIMMFGQLEHLLIEQGFNKVPSNLPEFTFFFHGENTYVNVLHIIDYKQNLYITQDQYWHIREKIMDFFHAKGMEDVHILSLLISEDVEKAKQLCVNDRFCWLIDPAWNRLLIYEGQVDDFYGMKSLLENFLYDVSRFSSEEKDTGNSAQTSADVGENKTGKLPLVNILLVFVNVILFVICTFTGEMLYNIGAFSVLDLTKDGGWYRVLTSMFLHADIQHLVSNMLVLYYIGNLVEKRIGHLQYVIIYFLSGIVGDIFSAGYELFTQQYVSSVGASGAVFGIEGALLFLVIINEGKIKEIAAGRLAFAIAFSLYCGFTSAYVNNMAHVGGVLTGFAAAAIFWLFSGIGKSYN